MTSTSDFARHATGVMPIEVTSHQHTHRPRSALQLAEQGVRRRAVGWPAPRTNR